MNAAGSNALCQLIRISLDCRLYHRSHLVLDGAPQIDDTRSSY
jgi:hypothetical protein